MEIIKAINKYGEWVKLFEFKNEYASGEHEVCITKGGEGYIVTVNSSSDMPGFTTPKCVFNEEYHELDFGMIVDDLHRQRLEDLSDGSLFLLFGRNEPQRHLGHVC